MLDFYTCTECGRCQDVCPAYDSGLTLSPKLLMMSLRDNLMERGAALSAGSANGASWKSAGRRCDLRRDVVGLHHLLRLRPGVPAVHRTRHARLWTCAAIWSSRAEWTPNCRRRWPTWAAMATPSASRRGCGPGGHEGLQPKIKDARKEPVEYLWFVGDYASYSRHPDRHHPHDGRGIPAGRPRFRHPVRRRAERRQRCPPGGRRGSVRDAGREEHGGA